MLKSKWTGLGWHLLNFFDRQRLNVEKKKKKQNKYSESGKTISRNENEKQHIFNKPSKWHTKSGKNLFSTKKKKTWYERTKGEKVKSAEEINKSKC